jgi:hypothetical protein
LRSAGLDEPAAVSHDHRAARDLLDEPEAPEAKRKACVDAQPPRHATDRFDVGPGQEDLDRSVRLWIANQTSSAGSVRLARTRYAEDVPRFVAGEIVVRFKVAHEVRFLG